jgi:hypothetical protein
MYGLEAECFLQITRVNRPRAVSEGASTILGWPGDTQDASTN